MKTLLLLFRGRFLLRLSTVTQRVVAGRGNAVEEIDRVLYSAGL